MSWFGKVIGVSIDGFSAIEVIGVMHERSLKGKHFVEEYGVLFRGA